MTAVDPAALRQLYPRVLAKTLARARSLPDAEDAVQDAITAALEQWPVDGAPASPEGWLVTVAARRFYDQTRRNQRQGALERLAAMSPWLRVAVGERAFEHAWKDDLLRLLFACADPALEPGESAALALSTVIGLSVREVSVAFAVAPRSMEQRLTRARQRLRARGEAHVPPADQAGERLDAVLRTLYLLFNEGYWSSDDRAPIRGDLCRLATGLARAVGEAFPGEPEVLGLLALMLFHDARRGARLDAAGAPVPLPEQDRTRWDATAFAEGMQWLDRALALARPGPFQVEAAISAVHGRAAAADQTDWTEISALYALLERMRPTPAVRVNRAFAVGRARGPAAGLELLAPDGPLPLETCSHVHLVRGVLLEELGELEAARASLVKAITHARNASERAAVEARVGAIDVLLRRDP